MRHLQGGIGSECGRCATVPRRALCGASPCPVRCVPGCGWVSAPLHRLRGCVGFCGGCGCVFHINRYLRPPCAPVVPCGGSVCPLRGSDGVPCPAPPLRTICRPAWPVVRPVGSVCGVGWVSASLPPIAPPVPSCALSQRPTIPPYLCHHLRPCVPPRASCGLWGGCAPICSCRGLLCPCSPCRDHHRLASFTTSGGIRSGSLRFHTRTRVYHISLTRCQYAYSYTNMHFGNKNIRV